MEHSTIRDMGRAAETHMGLAFTHALEASRCPHVRQMYGGLILITGCPHPLGNFTIGVTDADEAAKELADSGYPASMLFYGSSDPQGEANLDEYGFKPVSPLPAMAVDLTRLRPAEVPAGYEFRRLKPSDDLSQWTPAFSEGYGLPRELAEWFSPEKILFDDRLDAPLQFFEIGYEGKPVSVSCMSLAEGVAGIYCVATLPEHRGKGLGTFATAEPLRQARSLGYETGVLQASDLGYPVYKKLGFEDVGSLRMYLRMPPA